MSIASLALSDPRVPGVATIGEADALRDLLARVDEQVLDRGYLRYKPGTSLVASLRLASGPAFAYAVSEDARVKLTKTSQRAPVGSLVWDSASDGLLIARPAADRDLPALADPARLARCLPGDCPVTAVRMLAYKPHRRFVGSVPGRDGDQRRVVRACRPADVSGVLTGWRVAALVGEVAGVTVPRVHARSERYGLAVTSWLPGVPLDRLLVGATPDGAITPDSEVLAAVGADLARAHRSARRPGSARTADRMRAARAVAAELSTVLPNEGERVAALVRELGAMAPRPASESGWVHPAHGDLSADQVIIGPDGRVGLTDWDRAGWDDPAADLGSLRAAGLPPDAYAAVLDGYRSVRDLPVGVSWHIAAAEAARLTEPLRRCRPDWRREIADRLAAVEVRLAGLASARVLEPARSGVRAGWGGSRGDRARARTRAE